MSNKPAPALKFTLYDPKDVEYTPIMLNRANEKYPLDLMLYHGTTYFRMDRQTELRLGLYGWPIVSFSTSIDVAKEQACLSYQTDMDDQKSKFNSPIVYPFYAKTLLDHNVRLRHFSDPIWGVGHCDHEFEICSKDPVLLSWGEHPITINKDEMLHIRTKNGW